MGLQPSSESISSILFLHSLSWPLLVTLPPGLSRADPETAMTWSFLKVGCMNLRMVECAGRWRENAILMGYVMAWQWCSHMSHPPLRYPPPLISLCFFLTHLHSGCPQSWSWSGSIVSLNILVGPRSSNANDKAKQLILLILLHQSECNSCFFLPLVALPRLLCSRIVFSDSDTSQATVVRKVNTTAQICVNSESQILDLKTRWLTAISATRCSSLQWG